MQGVLVLLLPLLSPAAVGDTGEWSQFLGPGGSCRIESAALPDTLDPEETLRWRVDLAGGYSSPIIHGDRIYLTSAEGKELRTECLDRADGKEVWRSVIEFSGKRPGANSPAAPTPATDGKAVYCAFHEIGVVAYDMEGKELWRADVGPFTIPHGFSSSPIVHDDLLVLQVDQDSGSYLIAWDKKTGEERWKVERPGVTHSYSSPALYVPVEGPAQVILSSAYRISGHSLKDGKELWWVDDGGQMPMTSPMVVADRAIVCNFSSSSTESGLPNLSGSFEKALEERDADGDGLLGPDEFENRMIKMAFFVFDLDDDGFFDERDWDYLVRGNKASGGLYAIQLDGRGDVTETKVDWSNDNRRGLSETASPLVYDETIFLLKGGGLLSTYDLTTGELDHTERIGEPDQYWATPVLADGKIYLASLYGMLTVISADAEWDVLSETNLNDSNENPVVIWSTPAIAGDQIFIRAQDALYCFGLPKE